jgi:pantoate--beta-alanine ligase
MQDWSRAARRQGVRVGLVPTMGYLHDGHLSLIRRAQALSERVVVSIFVNPIQFSAGEDLAAYPRDFVRDAVLCERGGVAVVFHPDASEMYAPDFSTHVDESSLSAGLCGRRRAGHFRGVATVVSKLFNAVLPDVAVFGQKDAQQVRVIQRMVRDLNFPIEVIVAPIVREPDGLAMSSRNAYLNGTLRQDALCLRRALDEAERLFRAGERDATVLQQAMEAVIRRVPSAVIDYVEIVDDQTLKPVGMLKAPSLVALAVKVGSTRLIDNTVLGD